MKKREWRPMGEHFIYFDNEEAQIALMEKKVRFFLRKGMRLTVCIRTEKFTDE